MSHFELKADSGALKRQWLKECFECFNIERDSTEPLTTWEPYIDCVYRRQSAIRSQHDRLSLFLFYFPLNLIQKLMMVTTKHTICIIHSSIDFVCNSINETKNRKNQTNKRTTSHKAIYCIPMTLIDSIEFMNF